MPAAVLFPPDIFVDHLLVTLRDAQVRLPGSELPLGRQARQAAALAVVDGEPDHLVAAALLGGIGHVIAASFTRHPAVDPDDLEQLDQLDPTVLAADHLRLQFPDAVTRPIELLPTARRYLGAGGVVGTGDSLGALSRARFEVDPAAADAVTLALLERRSGRGAMLCPTLDAYRDLLYRLCTEALALVRPRLKLIS